MILIRSAFVSAVVSVLAIGSCPAQSQGSGASAQSSIPNDWKSGRTYLVTDAEKTLRFGGKEIVLPRSAEFQFQDGFLVIALSSASPKDAAVVKVGSTYLVITKKEKLVLDPNGVPRNPRFAYRSPRSRTPFRNAINDVPNASPFQP